MNYRLDAGTYHHPDVVRRIADWKRRTEARRPLGLRILDFIVYWSITLRARAERRWMDQ